MSTSSASSTGTSSSTSTMTSTAASSVVIPPSDAPAEKHPDEMGKIRMFLSILKRFIGVTDISSIRFSLPAQLLEPTPNLEYWNYLDRPETFIAIGDSEDPVDRMLEVLRFWFTKDLKYVKGKPCKPYNSTLGEFFRCNWEVTETSTPIALIKSNTTGNASSSSSIRSSRSGSVSQTPPSLTYPQATKLNKPVRVSYLTEQTSHHPPVSAFVVECPEKGLSARGFDQLAAKFTGTSIKVTPGEHNLGIFITLHKRGDEQYQLTHPAAFLGGLIRGNLSVSVGDQCYITCAKTGLKTILHYVEEGWIGKSQNRVEGAVFKYDPNNDNIHRLKDVPEKDILARVSGNWRERVYFSLGSKITNDQSLLIDLGPLTIQPKVIPPMSKQLPNESLRFWSGVTEAISSRQFSRATALKVQIEERQREKAKQRQETGFEWTPRFFVGSVTPLGKPELTPDGVEVIKGLQEEQWDMKESEYLAS